VRNTNRNRDREKLTKLFRSLREAAQLRQIDLAKRLGKPQSFVSKYESGERRLDLPEIRSICDALGISLKEFVEEFDRVTNETE
jgi:transcriptional regulator with XRE-family HTH domain